MTKLSLKNCFFIHKPDFVTHYQFVLSGGCFLPPYPPPPHNHKNAFTKNATFREIVISPPRLHSWVEFLLAGCYVTGSLAAFLLLPSPLRRCLPPPPPPLLPFLSCHPPGMSSWSADCRLAAVVVVRCAEPSSAVEWRVAAWVEWRGVGRGGGERQLLLL